MIFVIKHIYVAKSVTKKSEQILFYFSYRFVTKMLLKQLDQTVFMHFV